MREKNENFGVIILGIFIILISGFLLRSDGGINLDTIIYCRMARDFPKLTTNIFPIGYPLALKFVSYIINDFFWASKFINIFVVISIISFSKIKNFYFFETILILTIKCFSGIFYMSISEILFLGFLYFQIYMFHLLFHNPSVNISKTIIISLVFFILCLFRHTGIFIFLGSLISIIIMERISKKSASYRSNHFFIFLISSILISIYLSFNNKLFGSFFGESQRGTPEIFSSDDFKNHLFLNFKGLVSIANPFYTMVFQYSGAEELSVVRIIVFLVDILFLAIVIYLLLIKLRDRMSEFYVFILSNIVVYSILLLASSLFAGIEILNTRLLSPSTFMLYLLLFILYSDELKKKINLYKKLSIFSLIINFTILIKNPSNYLKIRNQAIEILESKKNASYFFDDLNQEKISHYELPIFGISFDYKHKSLESGHIAYMAVGILKPELIEIKDISNVNPYRVIYSSEILAQK